MEGITKMEGITEMEAITKQDGRDYQTKWKGLPKLYADYLFECELNVCVTILFHIYQVGYS